MFWWLLRNPIEKIKLILLFTKDKNCTSLSTVEDARLTKRDREKQRLREGGRKEEERRGGGREGEEKERRGRGDWEKSE